MLESDGKCSFCGLAHTLPEVVTDTPPVKEEWIPPVVEYPVFEHIPFYKNKIIILIALILVAVIVIFIITAPARSKTFSEAGLTIILNTDFIDKTHGFTYTAFYESKTVMIFTLKYDFSTFREYSVSTDLSLKEFAEILAAPFNENRRTEVRERDGLVYFEFTNVYAGRNLSNKAFVFRGYDAFWLVQFSCETRDYNRYRDRFLAWAKTIRV